MAKKKKAPELTFQQHIANYLVRKHKYGVLKQTGTIATSMHWIAPSEKDSATGTRNLLLPRLLSGQLILGEN